VCNIATPQNSACSGKLYNTFTVVFQYNVLQISALKNTVTVVKTPCSLQAKWQR